MSQPTANATLRWSPACGFELDLNASVQGVQLAFAAMPLPADGTVELRGGALELDKLDLLFKAQIDVNGSPGQLHEAQMTIAGEETDSSLNLECVVEDVETGDLKDLKIEMPLVIPDEAPKAGGPKPTPADEAELDWEDDDTLEAMFRDPEPTHGGAFEPIVESKERPAGGGGKGFDALLKALLSMGDEGAAGNTDEQTPAEPVASVVAEAIEEHSSPEPADLDPGNARGLLALLIENGDLELEPDFTVDHLVKGAALIVAALRPAGQRAMDLSQWLFSQDAVAELYMDDESLASLLEQW